jgi:ArsR family transcriptional regulator
MESKTTIRALGALAHETRLAIFRLLVQAGEPGLPVGALGEKLDLAPATLSFHLAALRHAGIVTARREGRTLHQAADYGAMDALLGYLTENCCQGADCGIAACAPTGSKRTSKTAKKESRHETPARARRRR